MSLGRRAAPARFEMALATAGCSGPSVLFRPFILSRSVTSASSMAPAAVSALPSKSAATKYLRGVRDGAFASPPLERGHRPQSNAAKTQPRRVSTRSPLPRMLRAALLLAEFHDAPRGPDRGRGSPRRDSTCGEALQELRELRVVLAQERFGLSSASTPFETPPSVSYPHSTSLFSCVCACEY